MPNPDPAAKAADEIHRRIFDNEPSDHNSYRLFVVLIRDAYAPLIDAARRVCLIDAQPDEPGIRMQLAAEIDRLRELLPEGAWESECH